MGATTFNSGGVSPGDMVIFSEGLQHNVSIGDVLNIGDGVTDKRYVVTGVDYGSGQVAIKPISDLEARMVSELDVPVRTIKSNLIREKAPWKF